MINDNNMDIAVIATGGKQYQIRKEQVIEIEKLNGKNGDKVAFDNVLLLSDDKGDKIQIGAPFIEDVKVQGEIVEQARKKKVLIVKFKRKGHYRRKVGHRQPYTKVKILKIS